MEIQKHLWPSYTRPCNFALCLNGGSVFADFGVDSKNQVFLIRASFDGYGCCEAKQKKATRMSPEDSLTLLQAVNADDLERDSIRDLLRRHFRQNQSWLWKDALEEHALL